MWVNIYFEIIDGKRGRQPLDLFKGYAGVALAFLDMWSHVELLNEISTSWTFRRDFATGHGNQQATRLFDDANVMHDKAIVKDNRAIRS